MFMVNANVVSVTGLVAKFQQPFNKTFWAGYKALEFMMGGAFESIKASLNKTKMLTDSFVEKFVDLDEFKQERERILKEWAEVTAEACNKGNIYHQSKVGDSEYVVSEVVCDTCQLPTQGKFLYREMPLNLKVDSLTITGIADAVLTDDTDLYVYDYKTSKKINKRSYFNKVLKKNTMMKYPLGHLEDCNYNHYALQISLYAYMLENRNPEMNVQDLYIIHCTDSGENKIKVPYLRKEVESMIREYKKTLLINQQYDRNKPIEY